MKLKVYYGKPDQDENLENPEGVWSGYSAVYHLNQHPAGSIRRARGDNSAVVWQDGVVVGSPEIVDGAATRGLDMNNIDGNYVSLGQENLPLSNLTIQAMVQVDAINGLGDQRVLSKAQGTSDADHVFMISTIPISGGGHQWRFRLKVNGTTQTYIRDVPYAGGITTDGTTPYWLSFVFSGDEILDYVNGTLPDVTDILVAVGSVTQNAWPVMIGNQPDGVGGTTSGKALNGAITEVRVCSSARDVDWVATEFAMFTQFDEADITYGPEVNISGVDEQFETLIESLVFGDTFPTPPDVSAYRESESLVFREVASPPGYKFFFPEESLVFGESLTISQIRRMETERESLSFGERFQALSQRDRISLLESLILSETQSFVSTEVDESESAVFSEQVSTVDVFVPAPRESLSFGEAISVVLQGEAITEEGGVRPVGWKRVWWVAQARRITEFD